MFRSRKIKNKYFLTTDHGSYCILNKEEYNKLKNNDFLKNSKLYKKLEEREILNTDNNINETKRLSKSKNEFLSQGTSLHIIVLTLRCNMNCEYCHAAAKGETNNKYDMTIETAKKTVDFIFQTPSKSITIEFQGGETLINWDVLKYIVSYSKEKNKIAKKNLVFTTVSNLSEMTNEKLEYLIAEDVDICTSFDGPKDLHDTNRPTNYGSNYDVVVKWIRTITHEYKKRNIPKEVGALVTLTKKSLNYPKQIVDEYINLGLKSLHLRFLNVLGRSEHNNKIHYTAEEFMSFWKKAMKYIIKKQQEGFDIEERMANIMIDKITSEFDPGYLDLRNPCGAVIGQMAYNYDGNIYTCDEGRMIDDDIFKVGNVFENTYKEVVTSDCTCTIVNSSILDGYSTCKICAYKPYCGICPVCNYAEQGNLIAKISETIRCKIYKAQFDWLIENYFFNNNEKKKK